MRQKSSFALIIPCYNEEQAIPSFRTEVLTFTSLFSKKLPFLKLQFVFVDNNSKDGSKALLQDLVHTLEDGCACVVSCETQGYGAALKLGFAAVEAEWYGFADLDNTYPLHSFIEMLSLATSENLQMVFTNRLQENSQMPGIRNAGNLLYSYLGKILFTNSVPDMCSGMRVFNFSCLDTVLKLSSNGLNFSIELTAFALKLGWRKRVVNINYRTRIGESKLSVFKDGFAFLFTLLKVWLKRLK